MNAGEATALRVLAEELARSAGAIAMAGFAGPGARPPGDHDTKSSATDPVTEHDRAAERLLVETLTERRAQDGIVGEEGARRSGSSGIDWHVDPIDGTANFVYGLPFWCTSVAAVDRHGSLAGAVYAPVIDEMFSAARSAGATLNGHTISVSEETECALAMIATGFSYRPERRRRQADRLARVLPEVRDLRRCGSAALDLCSVACGRVDAYFEEHLNSWDVAAGILIAAEAGATVTAIDGGEISPQSALVAAPGVHAALLELLEPA